MSISTGAGMTVSPQDPPIDESDCTMHISLIATYHAERGAVTASALLALLERIQPVVVFAETPLTHIDAWKDGSLGTVESMAVAHYANTHPIDVVPVDSQLPDSSFFETWNETSRVIERTSPKCRHLIDLNTQRMCEGGFVYLNSDECIQAWTDIHCEELETIEYCGDSRLRDAYARVRDLNEQREQEMLRNIRAYCASAMQTRCVFLVGAAHRKSLIEKIRALGETTTPRIQWDTAGSQIGAGA
jgi:hypothetical protein